MVSRLSVLVLGGLLAGACGTAVETAEPATIPPPAFSPTEAASPPPTSGPTTRPIATTGIGYDSADLERSIAIVEKLIAYAENMRGDGSVISYTLAERTLEQMHALADDETAWAFGDARLPPAKREALKDAIATALSFKDVLDAVEGDEAKALALGFALETYLPRLRSDLITLQ